MEKVVSVRQLVTDLELSVISGIDKLDKEIVLAEIHRPGVELTGYLVEGNTEIEQYIHVIGKEEMKYFYSLEEDVRKENIMHYLSYNFPCLIITNDINVDKEFIEIAKLEGKPILHTEKTLQKFIKKLRSYLQKELAPEIVLNKFTMLEVYGMGIMITGDESAKIGATIELLEKGHRFITDELLVIKRVSDTQIIAENGFNQKSIDYNYFLNLYNDDRINVIDYFGIGAARKSKEIDLIVKFEKWDDTKFYDRLGLEIERQYILGVEVPKIIIPVRKGRNLGIIVETAAINERLKKSGKNSAIYFVEETQKLIAQNKIKNKKSGDKKMGISKEITAREISDRFGFKILSGENLLDEKRLLTPNIHRPSLEFSGFYEILEDGGSECLQLIGKSELKYLDRLITDKRDKYLETYLNYTLPFIIITGTKNAPDYFLKKIEEKKHLLMCTEKDISEISADLIEYLEISFAPEITMHGVLVEVFGFGVLLIGKSGIGKSETALELIHRGHRLIADDMVKFTKYGDGRVVGTADKIPYFMEVRGLGIIDIKTLYGLGSVRKQKQLDVIIELKELKAEEYLTKTEDKEEEVVIMEERYPKIELYISSGRNAASMVEISTMNLRAKKLGYDANEIFTRNYENMKKMNKKESLFLNLGNLITGRKK